MFVFGVIAGVVFAGYAAAQASPDIPWPAGCPGYCFIASFEKRVEVASRLLGTSQEYALQWQSDCNCPDRAQSFREAAIKALEQAYGNIFNFGGTIKRTKQTPSTCTWADVDTLYKRMNGDLKTMCKYLQLLQKSVTTATCDRLKTSIDSVYEDYLATGSELTALLTSNACATATCDGSLTCRTRDLCRPPCEKYALAQWWLDVADAKAAAAKEAFLRAAPGANCCDPCAKSMMATEEVHQSGRIQTIFVLDSGAYLGITFGIAEVTKSIALEDLKKKSGSVSAQPKASSAFPTQCSGEAGWAAVYSLIEGLPSLIQALRFAYCSASKCPELSQITNYVNGCNVAIDAVYNAVNDYALSG